MSRAYYKKRCEATEQERVINWATFYAKDFPELDLLYHVPNGGSRNQLEAANLKRQGVKAGVPDLVLRRSIKNQGLQDISFLVGMLGLCCYSGRVYPFLWWQLC